MTVRMRHTKGHSGNRRSHHALKEARFSICSSCGKEHIRHQVCSNCGTYRGRTVIDVKAQQERRLQRRQEKLKALGQNAKQETQESS